MDAQPSTGRSSAAERVIDRLPFGDRIARTTLSRAFVLFWRIEGLERALAMAARVFVAMIPLALLTSSLTASGGRTFGDLLVLGFGLHGDAAEAARTLFETNDEVRASAGLFGASLIVYSIFSYTGTVQRMFAAVWRTTVPTAKAARRRLTWLAGVVLYATIAVTLDGWRLAHGLRILGIVSIALFVAMWAWTPYALVGGRTLRTYLPTGVAAAVGQGMLVIFASDWMHRVFDANGGRYGPIGIALSLVSWLFLHAIVLTASAAVGAVIGGDRGGTDGSAETEKPSAATEGEGRDT